MQLEAIRDKLEDMPSSGTLSNSLTHALIASLIADRKALEAKIEALEAAAKAPAPSQKSGTRFSELDDEKHISIEELGEWLDISKNTLYKDVDKPPAKKVGKSLRYQVKDVREWLANLPRAMHVVTPVLHYQHAVLGLEAAIEYEAENEEAVPNFVDILCLGEFKHMKLGQELLQSPLPSITPEVAKDFDTATWVFLELTNGKPLPTKNVIQALRHLRDSGNDLNQPNNLMQKTAAHMLADYGDKLTQEEVSTLMNTFLDHGLNVYAEDFQGQSALALAPIGGYMEKWERSRNFAGNLEKSLAMKPEITRSQVKKGI